MLFRGKQPEASIWRRFRASTDGFTFTESDGVYAAHVVANAERVVDLFWSLSDMLSPAVDLYVEDLRSGRSWKGEALALPDVRDMIARLRLLIARFGGTEISVYDAEDQFSLTANLELYIYSRSDRWMYLLNSMNLEERATLEERLWGIQSWERAPAPALSDAVAAAADRLAIKST